MAPEIDLYNRVGKMKIKLQCKVDLQYFAICQLILLLINLSLFDGNRYTQSGVDQGRIN